MKEKKHNNMIEYYLVSYMEGDLEVNLFVSEKQYAQKYIDKFNRILNIVRKRNEQFEDEDYWIKSEFVQDFSYGYCRVNEMSKAYLTPIEFRK